MLIVVLALFGAAFAAAWFFMRGLARHSSRVDGPYDWADDEVFG